MSVNIKWSLALLIVTAFYSSCSDDEPGTTPITPVIPTPTFDINDITDTYYDVASIDKVYQWGPYNVHDPSILKEGDTYYCYSTDAAYGTAVRPGIQVRKSKDLIKWDFAGWVFADIPAKGRDYITSEGATPNQGLWAPYIMKAGNEFRLYYSLASNVGRVSCIGLATATTPLGPWVEQDVVVRSTSTGTHTNAIDPSVIVDKDGKHWMYYGSSWDGIWIMELDPATGLAKTPGDKGQRIGHRGFTGGTINGNIEGPEIIYNPEFDKYYLFIAYDWLESKYNVRVSRADSPEGPFYDYNGNDINTYMDNGPMIIAPYQFNGHSGWQGVAHQAVFNDDEGNFYISHQGRPGIDRFCMVLHNRKLHWTTDGWPIASPERFAGVEQTTVTEGELVGNYEQIILGYNVVPGFASTQTSPDFQTAINLTINADGTLNNNEGNWTYDGDSWLTLSWSNGYTDVVHVDRGRDWENKVESTILFSGLNNDGTAIWAKKID